MGGVSVDAVTRADMLAVVSAAIRARRFLWLTFVNVSVVSWASRDRALRELLANADYSLCDGMGLIYGCRALGQPLPEMVSGPFLLFEMLQQAASSGHRVYFLGAAPDVIDEAVRGAERLYPGLQIVGARHGFFSVAEEVDVVQGILAARPDVLVVGMGFPRERRFIWNHHDAFTQMVCVDTGGAFTVLAGVHRLAPPLVRTLGLEWVYRMLQEPRRLFWRYLSMNTRFAGLILAGVLRRFVGRGACEVSRPN